MDCLSPTFHFHFDWGLGLKFVMFLGNINFISERQNWIEKDCIVKEGKVMPGGLSGADWSWVGGVVLLPGQPGSGPRLLGSRTREESVGTDKTNRESWMPADPPSLHLAASFRQLQIWVIFS